MPAPRQIGRIYQHGNQLLKNEQNMPRLGKPKRRPETADFHFERPEWVLFRSGRVCVGEDGGAGELGGGGREGQRRGRLSLQPAGAFLRSARCRRDALEVELLYKNFESIITDYEAEHGDGRLAGRERRPAVARLVDQAAGKIALKRR